MMTSNAALAGLRGNVAACLVVASLAMGGGAVQAASSVGTAAAVNTDAFGTPPGAVRQVKLIGDNVIFNERIETSGSGLVQVLLNDGSTFTVGANSNLVIDEFVYDPEAGTGKLVASFGKGVVRFVGGKVSKNKGGVAVKTPVGTIGIRGGIANLNLEDGNPVFSLLFGEELTFKGTNGNTRRLYQPGYSLQIDPAGLGAVRRTTASDLSAVQARFAAGAGQRGGVSRPPTNTQVSRSGVPGVNSNLGHIRTAPLPKPQGIQSVAPLRGDAHLVQNEKNSKQNIINKYGDEPAGALPQTPVDTPDETPVSTTADARILTSGGSFSPVWDSSRSVTLPGAQGLIGGSAALDSNIGFSRETVTYGAATELYKGSVEGTKVYQFAFDGDGQYFYAQTYTDQDQVAQQGESDFIPVAPAVDPQTEGNPVSYAWGAQFFHENFAMFAHLPDVSPGDAVPFDIEDMILGLHGVGTDFTAFGQGRTGPAVRYYDLAADPTLMFSLGTTGAGRTFTPLKSSALFVNPLVAAELGTSFMADIGSTGLKLIEDNAQTLEGAHYLASSFHISGSGADQKSLISLAVGEVVLEEGSATPAIGGARRGGHRIAPDQGGALYTGPAGTVAGPDGGHFFGSNAQSFVFGNTLSGAALDDPYNDNYITRPQVFQAADTVSAGVHVGRLNGAEIASTLSRTDRILTGYAAGILESTAIAGGQLSGPVVVSSKSAADLSMTFDRASHSLGGALTVRDAAGADPAVEAYTIRFGFNTDGTGSGRAAFIDDETYAARDASNRSETYVITDTGSKLEQNSAESPATYLVPDTLVAGADDAILASASQCTCAFLEWGYWGTQVSVDDPAAAGAGRRDTVHLGTWVAGDVTSSASLPASGSASYTGHAAGNVVNSGAQYLAAGDFQMTVDFARRTGYANIANFDGRVFGADLTEQTVASGNLFSGTLAGQSLNGNINTSIVGGPASNHQGVIGNFTASDGAWSATGIVAGEMQ